MCSESDDFKVVKGKTNNNILSIKQNYTRFDQLETIFLCVMGKNTKFHIMSKAVLKSFSSKKKFQVFTYGQKECNWVIL